MKQLIAAIKNMIEISEEEQRNFIGRCISKTFKRNELLSRPTTVPNEIFFVCSGLVRVIVTDKTGVDHTIHFALENQFIADYSCFMLKQPSLYSLEAIEDTETVILPRAAVEWGYQNLSQGDRLGRLIAEFYFIYQDNRVANMYARTPKERYDSISDVFPNIHNRVPQHMIASYLGITPVHLSRLKKSDIKKKHEQ